MASSYYQNIIKRVLDASTMMNTTEGRKLAEHRQAVMQEFLDKFMIEWEGKM